MPVFLITVLVLGFSYDTVRALTTPVVASVAIDNKVGIAEKAAIIVAGTIPVDPADTVVYATITDSSGNIAVGATSTPVYANTTAFSISVDGTTATPNPLVDGALTVTVTGTDGATFATSTDFTTASLETVRPTFTAKRTTATSIELTFSENVSASDTATAAWTLSDGTVTAATQPSGVNLLILTVSGISTITATPTVTYVAASGSVVDGYGNEVGDGSNAVAADFVAPTLAAVTPVPSPTRNITPSYTFSSDKAGTITYAGDCSSGTVAAVAGNNTVAFNALAEGSHSNCTVKVTDGGGNQSALLSVNTFSVDLTAPTFTAARTGVDTIVLTFNEAVVASSTAANAWTVIGGSVTAVATTSATSVSLTTTGITGTSATPTVNYVQVNGAFSDVAGNGVADGGAIVATDGVAPILLSAVTRTNNASSTLAKTGDVVTLYATSSEPIALPTVTIAGQGAAESFVVGATEFIATYTLAGTETEGNLAFTADFADAPVGNLGTQVTLTTDGIRVRYDKTAPSLSLTLPFADSFVRAASLITFGDNESTNPQCSVTGGALTVCTTGVTTLGDLNNFASVGEGATFMLTLSDTDLAGNNTTITRNLVKDTMAPTKPGAPTAVAGPLINDAEEAAGFVVVVPLGTSGALAGDTLELLVGGTSFPTPITATLNATDISNTNHSFTVVANQLGADGAKTITARVTDQANNLGASSDPLALTLDTTAPTAVLTYSTSTPVRAGVALTITATFSEAMAGTATKIALTAPNVVAATDMTYASTTAATYVHTVAAGDGTVTASLSVGTDLAGNSITAVPTSGATFEVDNTVPTITPVTIASNNASTTLAKAGDMVTLSFTTSETVGTPNVTIRGAAASVSGGPTNWTASRAMGGGDTEGVVTFTIDATDLAGNGAAQAAVTTDGSLVVFDKTAPVVTETTPIPSPTNDTTPNYTYSSTEEGTVVYGGDCNSTAGGTVPSGSTLVTFATLIEATHTNCTVTITDAAGNASAPLAVSGFQIDTTAPGIASVTSTTLDGAYSTSTPINLTVNFTENATSTLGLTLNTDTGSSCATGAFTNVASASCVYTPSAGHNTSDLNVSSVTGTITDAATNSATNPAPAASLASARAIVVDTTAPTVSSITTAKPDGFYTTGATVDFTVTMSEPVTVMQRNSLFPRISLNSGALAPAAAVSNSTTITFTYTVGSGDTSSDLDYNDTASMGTAGFILDAAGNAATRTLPAVGTISGAHAIVIDTTAPLATPAPTAAAGPLINAAEYTAGVQVVASTTGSGALEGDTISLLLGGSGFPTPLNHVLTAGEITAGAYTFTVSSGQLGADGAKLITSRVTDQATNAGPESAALALTLDTTAPASPSVSSIAGDNKINNAEKAGIVVVGTAEANALVSVTLTDASGNAKTGTEQLSGGATAFSITLDGTAAAPGAFVDGVVTPVVTATDAAGNTSAASVVPVTLQDTVAPPTPVIDFTDPVNLATVASSVLTGTGEGNTLVMATTTDGTLNVVTSGTVSALGAISITPIDVTSLAQGTLTTTVALRDGAGNVSGSASVTSEKDTVIPVFSSITPATSAYINNVNGASQIGFTLSEALSGGSVVITRTSGAADASSPHTCTLAGTAKTAGAHTVDLSDTTNGCTSAHTLVDGAVYSMSFFGTDVVGNDSATTLRTGITYDVTAPTVTISYPLPGASTANAFTVTSATSETATCALVLDSATTTMTTGGTSHTRALSALGLGAHTQAISCTDLASNTTLTPTRAFTVLATSGTNITATSTNAVFGSTLAGQADLPSGISNLIFSNTTLLDVSSGVSTASLGSITIGGAVQSLASITAPDLVAQDLSTPRTIGDQTFTLAKAVRLNSGVGGEGAGSPIVLTNNTLASVSLSIPDDTVVFGPAAWDGTIEPGRIQTISGAAPAGMNVADEFSFGSSQNLIFSKPVTILLPYTYPIAQKPAGSGTWTAIATCAGTYAAPVNPAFAGECSIADSVLGTKIVTYHLTSFASLTPTTVTGANGPQFVSTGGGGGGGGGPISQLSFGLSPQTSQPVVQTVATPASTGFVLGVKTFRFTKMLAFGSRNDDVKELQKILIAEGFLKAQATGYFGPLTRAAVISWQKKNKIAPPVGIIGPLSRAKLNS